MSSTAKRLPVFSQCATRETITSGIVMPGTAMMLTMLFSRNACIPVRAPGPRSSPIKVPALTCSMVPSRPPDNTTTGPSSPRSCVTGFFNSVCHPGAISSLTISLDFIRTEISFLDAGYRLSSGNTSTSSWYLACTSSSARYSTFSGTRPGSATSCTNSCSKVISWSNIVMIRLYSSPAFTRLPSSKPAVDFATYTRSDFFSRSCIFFFVLSVNSNTIRFPQIPSLAADIFKFSFWNTAAFAFPGMTRAT